MDEEKNFKEAFSLGKRRKKYHWGERIYQNTHTTTDRDGL
jgi:hypothetical protein